MLGASGLSLMAWSQGWDRGNHWDASSLNSRRKWLYTAGISTFLLPSPACMANLVAIPLMVVVSSSCRTIASFSSSICNLTITSHELIGCVDDMMIGSVALLIMALFHSNFGSKVVSHGYPSSMSSCPISVMRNRITLSCPLVVTFSSSK